MTTTSPGPPMQPWILESAPCTRTCLNSIVGIDGPTEEVIKLLDGGQEGAPAVQRVNVVSIVGKTTLARRVYEVSGNEFEYRAFVSVSRNPNVVTILRSILIQVGYDKVLPEDAQSLIDTISNFLRDKRYFIVVDDVWDLQTWDTLRCAFSKSSYGSRIVTTTRINEVAKSCCVSDGGRVYNLRPLSIVDSERLFVRRIFGSRQQFPPHLQRVCEKILQKCGGLPLAIIAISGLLATSAHEDQWEQVQNSMGHGFGSNPAVVGMMKILSFSYFDLSPCLKSCLLYLRWIWEGFIPDEPGHTLYELGERCFNELINRSLIEPWEETDLFGEVASCRVHDIILDFVISKSKEENFVVTLLDVPGVNPDPKGKVRRLCLHNGSEIATDLVLSNVRSLLVPGDAAKIPSLLEFRNLRVLDFQRCKQLEDRHLVGIGNLFHLKHLRLNDARITKFPEQIAKLQYLETLEIIHKRGTTIEIPSTICQLRRLAHLVVEGNIILPDEIGGMQALQVLGGIVIRHPTNFGQQLGQLTNLRKLSIEFDSRSVSGEMFEQMEAMVSIEAILSSISMLGKANLRSLCIKGGFPVNEGSYCPDFHVDYLCNESWFSALSSLRELIKAVPAGSWSAIPKSMKSFVSIQKLCLTAFIVELEDVMILGGLPSLRNLSLGVEAYVAAGSKEGPQITYLPIGEGRLGIRRSHGFPSLSYFLIGGINLWTRVDL